MMRHSSFNGQYSEILNSNANNILGFLQWLLELVVFARSVFSTQMMSRLKVLEVEAIVLNGLNISLR